MPMKFLFVSVVYLARSVLTRLSLAYLYNVIRRSKTVFILKKGNRKISDSKATKLQV